MFAGSFAPAGWMFCDGQLIPISENDALFTVIGTTYGGDGQETFALPNLQSRVPMHQGTNAGQTFQVGEAAGVESVTLTTQQIPVHSHPMVASTALGTLLTPNNNLTAESNSVTLYRAGGGAAALNAAAVTPVGGSQPHENCQPFLCISFIISLFGVFPTQT